MAGIEIRGLTRRYYLPGNRTVNAVAGLDLSVRDGELAVITGRSGCGKTTLLRLLAGLERPDDGRLEFVGTTGGSFPRIGVVFQEPRLMPWLTVAENIALPLVRQADQAAVRRSVQEILAVIGLSEYGGAYPAQISGGMAQRTALGRALCCQPDIILMDEPLGALDAFTRRGMQQELVKILTGSGRTVLFVTHDVDEAVLLGNRVFVMEAGRLRCEFPVKLPVPRDTRAPEFFALREAILREILKGDG